MSELEPKKPKPAADAAPEANKEPASKNASKDAVSSGKDGASKRSAAPKPAAVKPSSKVSSKLNVTMVPSSTSSDKTPAAKEPGAPAPVGAKAIEETPPPVAAAKSTDLVEPDDPTLIDAETKPVEVEPALALEPAFAIEPAKDEPALADAAPEASKLEATQPEAKVEAKPVVLRLFGRTDVGQVREHNEDNFVVADLTKASRGLMEPIAADSSASAARCSACATAWAARRPARSRASSRSTSSTSECSRATRPPLTTTLAARLVQRHRDRGHAHLQRGQARSHAPRDGHHRDDRRADRRSPVPRPGRRQPRVPPARRASSCRSRAISRS
jgi:hypothetical protein